MSAPPTKMDAQASFDAFAENYDEALKQGLAASGEGKEFYARGRLVWLAQRLRALEFQPTKVLDYGCGTGSATPFFFECLPVQSVLGVDISEQSLEYARRQHGSERVQFAPIQAAPPDHAIDLAFCNGVFHHIPPPERAGCVDYVFQALRPGGLFAFCENNPWNPGTRYVMSKIPFDKDAITLPPPEAQRLLKSSGFELLRTDFLFFFPGSLGFLRGLEPALRSVPLGGQYMVLCRKPAPFF